MTLATKLEPKDAPVEFRREIGGERALLMLPLNVVVVGRVRGDVDPVAVAAALESLRARHVFLGVRVELDDEGNGVYTTDGVPPFEVDVAERTGEEDWLARVKREYRRSFSTEHGPLVRCSLVRSPEVCEILLCGHHAICDGRSLIYLLRDLLELLASGNEALPALPAPPPIDASTVAAPPTKNALLRLLVRLVNRSWAKKKIRFNEAQMKQMHRVFWAANRDMPLLAWQMSEAATSALVERCRAEDVTVNSALWTAFLAAEQSVRQRRRRFSAMAVSTRDKLLVPVGEQLGFYAASLTVELPYDPDKPFWDNARRIHERITHELAWTNLFRMLGAVDIHPTLIDSLYFAKYGLLDARMSRKFLKKMRWHEVSYGYAITNLGRMDIPLEYGPYRLEAVYGSFYSDVEDAVVGVTSVGGRLACTLTAGGYSTHDARRLRDTARERLAEAVSAGKR